MSCRSRSPDRYRERDRGYDRDRGGGGYDRGGDRDRGGGDRGGGGGYRRLEQEPIPSARVVFIGGLNFMTEERDLQRYFGDAGKVVAARVVRDPNNGHSRGFGFVGFAREDEVDVAIRKMDGEEIHGRRVAVQRAKTTLY
ncbi:Glycine-rich RNA-binding protein 8 [Monoraphidium neglectum]|uniref:Glycine-rich RNA-binding protein 8 n=1 Tax=Monoraphidium neglectum TaxID=145388 RepID=A0A0D2L552_9CHLO|nr:Glycine-rich RNA-binding protein 8 [Monoraphidium neglectum]KIZ02154.1 Glycine-rich RNA-binding protein 8 [Monoraphidium neglectum]|eukprot:XP_013901173.1 Glycine-rich RNA-binding protein 8 [Monoraphidium neglectum]